MIGDHFLIIALVHWQAWDDATRDARERAWDDEWDAAIGAAWEAWGVDERETESGA